MFGVTKFRCLCSGPFGVAAVSLALISLTGCEPGPADFEAQMGPVEPLPQEAEPVEPGEPEHHEPPEPPEPQNAPVEPEEPQIEHEEPNQREAEELDLEDLGMPDQEITEPDPVDIEDPERDSDTVLATVEGEAILLQDLYDEFDRIPPQQQQQLQHQQHEILEQMVQQTLLEREAREKEVQESEEFKEMIRQLEASPMAAELEKDEIKKSAMMETLIQQEVVEKVDITEGELRETFDQYAQMMPEEAGFEQMKPHIKHMLLQKHVMDYIHQLQDDAEVDLDEDWMEEKEEEAMDATPIMPGGEAPPVQ